MTISFVVTTYNVAPYVEPCLDSLAEIAMPGDEIVLVDDGSNDATIEKVQEFAASSKLRQGVEFRPLFLGTNTIGGVGIGANIGLAEASCDTVFFVDGDDWVNPDGFRAARSYWEGRSGDILFTNYLEYNERDSSTKPPADQARWQKLEGGYVEGVDPQTALAFIAVPWRKFYRREFLEQHHLRFPEGDFFFEDNPFHWAVCLAAKRIDFFDTVVCYHRTNRPGQTMVSTGNELSAFFVHFDTILSLLTGDKQKYRPIAARWLLSNMTWHLARLSSSVYPRYFSAASRALRKIDDAIWTEDLEKSEGDKKIWPVADRLRGGDVWGVIDSLRIEKLEKDVRNLAGAFGRLDRSVLDVKSGLDAFSAIARFDALKDVLDD